MSDKLEINSAYIDQLTALIEKNNSKELIKILDELHITDIAEIIEDLSSLEKYNIDPALATGPFITTVNDVLGLFIYFIIGQAIL